MAPNDPALSYLLTAAGPVDLDRLDLDSSFINWLREGGVKLVVPLVSQGELIGLLNLGPRRSERDYSADDRRLLQSLAAQAAPAVRVAQLVREQEAEVRMRERYQQELQIAHLIQQNFLPKHAPVLAGWHLAAFYRSAREVGGDFYDFIDLPDGRVGIVVGDVTDKGVPAALVMASTRSVLRGAAKRGLSPGLVLERVNELVCPEMPPKMFVTCLYGVLEPDSGRFVYANAGHDLPYKSGANGVEELRACGMPLGLMPGMTYEEKVATIGPGETVLFSSDGLVEAHDAGGGMFGCPRVIELMTGHAGGSELIDFLLTELHRFTGAGWEQEDDITMVTLQRTAYGAESVMSPIGNDEVAERVLVEFVIPSEPGNERIAMARVEEAVAGVVPGSRIEKLKTAVAEATMNAIEHGNENRPELDVAVRVVLDGRSLRVRIVDEGGGRDVPEAAVPDLDAKLSGLQTPRGWGLFLIKNMVDELDVSSDDRHHTIELVMHLEGEA
jgi:serine phosphatase RsbU (regulator of sigma subunit)/anti-sigma regulatory factor (Ser/Thr protein kinase)